MKKLKKKKEYRERGHTIYFVAACPVMAYLTISWSTVSKKLDEKFCCTLSDPEGHYSQATICLALLQIEFKICKENFNYSVKMLILEIYIQNKVR